MDARRWSALCGRLEVDRAAARFDVLEESYGEPHRHYHTAAHVDECLALLDECLAHPDLGRGRVGRPDEVEFALWLHDAVYRPTRADNEERSARLAEGWLGGSAGNAAAVRALILATRHHEPAAGGDEALIQDIDLAILGAPPGRFEEYCGQIRREYRWVPGPLYRRRRAGVLRSFLEREAIYGTAWFRERFEDRARRNLEAAVSALDAGEGAAGAGDEGGGGEGASGEGGGADGAARRGGKT